MQEWHRKTFAALPQGQSQSRTTFRFLNSFISFHPCFPWEIKAQGHPEHEAQSALSLWC